MGCIGFSCFIMLLIIGFLSFFLIEFILLIIYLLYSVDLSLMCDVSVSLMPWFVTGYADAESCFSFSVVRSSTTYLGWRIQLVFEISAANNVANRKLLEDFRNFFGGGHIR